MTQKVPTEVRTILTKQVDGDCTKQQKKGNKFGIKYAKGKTYYRKADWINEMKK